MAVGCILVVVILFVFLFDWRTAVISFTAIPAGTASISGQVFGDGNGDGKKGIDAIGLSGTSAGAQLPPASQESAG